MKGNCLSGTPSPAVDICCANQLNRPYSEASTLSAEISEDILHRSPDKGTMWTDKRHSLYLENLEASFVKQLHQSINFLAQCSNQDEGNKHPISAHDTSEQLISCKRSDPLPHVSVNSLSHIKSPSLYRSKRIGMVCPTSSPHTRTLCDTENHLKVLMSHRKDLVKEGTGQNFADEDDETNADAKSRVKRLKTLLPE